MKYDRVRARTLNIGFPARWRIHAKALALVLLSAAILLAWFWLGGATTPQIVVSAENDFPLLRNSIDAFASSGDVLALLSGLFLLAWTAFYVFCVWSVFISKRDYIASHIAEGAARGRLLNIFGRFPSGVAHRLARMDANEGEPFVLCRNACHAFAAYAHAATPWLGGRLVEKLRAERRILRSWGRFNQLNYLVTMAIADALRTDWKMMRGEGHLYSDQITSRDEQKSVVREFNECDLPLRFIQAEPQRRFSRVGGAQLPKPTFVVFHCLFNSIKDPIWILPLRDVMAKLKEICAKPGSGADYDTVVRMLSSTAFTVYARIKDESGPDVLKVQFGESRQVAILHTDAAGKLRSGYDENNILYESLPLPACTALHLFQRALDEAAKNSICVQMRSGDVLLIRNQEAFFARREVDDHFISWPITLLQRARWLRTYYLYEKLPGEKVAGGANVLRTALNGRLSLWPRGNHTDVAA